MIRSCIVQHNFAGYKLLLYWSLQYLNKTNIKLTICIVTHFSNVKLQRPNQDQRQHYQWVVASKWALRFRRVLAQCSDACWEGWGTKSMLCWWLTVTLYTTVYIMAFIPLDERLLHRSFIDKPSSIFEFSWYGWEALSHTLEVFRLLCVKVYFKLLIFWGISKRLHSHTLDFFLESNFPIVNLLISASFATWICWDFPQPI